MCLVSGVRWSELEDFNIHRALTRNNDSPQPSRILDKPSQTSGVHSLRRYFSSSIVLTQVFPELCISWLNCRYIWFSWCHHQSLTWTRSENLREGDQSLISSNLVSFWSSRIRNHLKKNSPNFPHKKTLNKMDIYGALRSPASSDNITHYSLMICLCWVARRACVLCAGWHRPHRAVDILMWRHPGAPVVSSPPDSHHVSPQDSRHRIRHARWVHCDQRKKSSLVLD